MKKFTKLTILTIIPISIASCGDSNLKLEKFKPICESSQLVQMTSGLYALSESKYPEVCECIYKMHIQENIGIVTPLYSESISVINAMAEDGSLSKTSMAKEVNLLTKCIKSIV